jgi:ubiquinone/menaquinone biosynthesis C-methylase UbiE
MSLAPFQRSDQNEGYRCPGVHRFLTWRTAETTAWFLTPHLRPGMRLLDCGCGPATITVGLAERVAPGEAVGVDLAPVQVERGRALARERGLGTLRFQLADITALPFPDAAFDAAFTSNVLQYLADPLVGLRELRRVLTPGGVIGVVDADVSTLRLAPESAFTRAFLPLFRRWREQDASPYVAPELRRLLREAGFTRRQAFAYVEFHATPEETRALAEGLVDLLAGPMGTVVTEQGWADRATLDGLMAGARGWGADPDALWASLQLAAVGWAESGPVA